MPETRGRDSLNVQYQTVYPHINIEQLKTLKRICNLQITQHTCHTSIIRVFYFFEKYVRILTYFILFIIRVSSNFDRHRDTDRAKVQPWQ